MSQWITAAENEGTLSHVMPFSVTALHMHCDRSSSFQKPSNPHVRVTTLSSSGWSPHGCASVVLCGVSSHMPSAVHRHSWSTGVVHQPQSSHTRVIEPAMHACVTSSLRLPALQRVSSSRMDGHLQFWSFTGCHSP